MSSVDEYMHFGEYCIAAKIHLQLGRKPFSDVYVYVAAMCKVNPYQ